MPSMTAAMPAPVAAVLRSILAAPGPVIVFAAFGAGSIVVLSGSAGQRQTAKTKNQQETKNDRSLYVHAFPLTRVRLV